MEEKLLTQMKPEETGVVKEILGGYNVQHRLGSMGLRPGKKVTMISSHFWCGPVTVLVDKSKMAIGHGMAQKIVVEVDNG
ncbi:MAG: FeoA family protein [Candidatus Omnitrophota bacterium]|jgi:ferrous iron transport protein A